MLARAIALASVVADDETPLAAMPAPAGAAAVEARARLLAAARAGRGAAIARETMTLFATPAVPGARRALSRGLALAAAPAETDTPAAVGDAPADLARALRSAERLGLLALGRAGSASLAEIVRQLDPDDAAALLAGRRRSEDDAEAAALVLDAVGKSGASPAAIGRARVGWAACTEPGALHALARGLDGDDAARFVELGGWLWFAAGKRIPAALWDAEREAARIVEAAREEAARLHAEAVEQGRRDGLESAAAALVAVRAERARLLDDAERDVVELALCIARKILAAEVSLGPDAIARIAAEALVSARLGRAVVLRLHPDDAARLADGRDALLAAAGRTEGVVLRPDPGLAPGDCVVESELGTIDARIESQLAAIARALRGGPP